MDEKEDYTITTFRNYKDVGYKKGEFISHSVCSHSLCKACEYMEEYVNDIYTDCQFVLVLHKFSDGSQIIIHFKNDGEFLKFVDEVYDAELDDYEEWLRSYDKERTEQGLSASNGESSEIASEGNG